VRTRPGGLELEERRKLAFYGDERGRRAFLDHPPLIEEHDAVHVETVVRRCARKSQGDVLALDRHRLRTVRVRPGCGAEAVSGSEGQQWRYGANDPKVIHRDPG
jgi:hypothetical protein